MGLFNFIRRILSPKAQLTKEEQAKLIFGTAIKSLEEENASKEQRIKELRMKAEALEADAARDREKAALAGQRASDIKKFREVLHEFQSEITTLQPSSPESKHLKEKAIWIVNEARRLNLASPNAFRNWARAGWIDSVE